MNADSNQPLPTDHHWRTSDGIDIQARGWLVEQPRGLVVLVHGLGDHGGRYEHVAKRLNDESFSVVAPDMRGHGRSSGPRGYAPSFDCVLDDLGLAIEQSREIVADKELPLFLYGQSLGGCYVLNYCLRRTDRIAGCVASSPMLRVAFEPPAWKLWVGRTLGKWWPTFTLPTGLDLNELSRDASVVAAARRDPLRHRKISATIAFSMFEAGEWAIRNAETLAVPALLMHGTEDKITSHGASEEFSAAAAGNCELEIYPDCKHELHNEPIKKDVLDRAAGWLLNRRNS